MYFVLFAITLGGFAWIGFTAQSAVPALVWFGIVLGVAAIWIWQTTAIPFEYRSAPTPQAARHKMLSDLAKGVALKGLATYAIAIIAGDILLDRPATLSGASLMLLALLFVVLWIGLRIRRERKDHS